VTVAEMAQARMRVQKGNVEHRGQHQESGDGKPMAAGSEEPNEWTSPVKSESEK
jgi:hypothetical protein